LRCDSVVLCCGKLAVRRLQVPGRTTRAKGALPPNLRAAAAYVRRKMWALTRERGKHNN